MKTGRIPYLDADVSRIVCGTDFPMEQAPRGTFKAFDAYWEAGGRTFDTAAIYGLNTDLFALWAHDRGVMAEAIVMDKCGHPHAGAKRVTAAATREDHARSLERLRTDRVATLTYHRDDEDVPVGEIVDWTDELRKEGGFSAWGGSNWRHERIAEANAYAEANGKQPMSLDNPNLTLAHNIRPLWADCLTIGDAGRAWHEETQMPLFAWSSTARGYFAGTRDPDVVAAYDDEISRGRKARAEELGAKYGVGPVGIALAWVLAQPFPAFALCGLRTVENVAENVASAEIDLTPDEVRYLEHGG